MSISLISQRRTVLLMNDEALQVYRSNARGVELVDTVLWETEDFENHVQGLLDNECGKRPVVILNDMIEQHYRKERLPHKGVSVMDRKNVVQRKLNMAFPNYPVRSYIQMKSAGSKGASTYIFAALSASEHLTKVFASVRRSTVSIVGVFLLPTEASDMLSKLAVKTVPNAIKRSSWTVLISPHSGGGLRQIVVNDGELALTRMSIIDVDQENAVSWAEEVFKEFESTMGYLARFGYHSDDGLNIVLVSEPSAGDALQEKMNPKHNYASLTPGQAAAMLSITLGRNASLDYYADPLHVAWVSAKSKFIMPMQSPQLEQIAKPRKAVKYLSILALLVGLFFFYQAVNTSWMISQMNKEIEQHTSDKTQLDARYKKEVARVEALGYDIKLIQASTAVYSDLEKSRIDILPVLRSIGQALGRDLHLDELVIESAKDSTVEGFFDDMAQDIGGDQDENFSNEQKFEAKLIVKYPSTTDVDIGNKEITDLSKRLQLYLPRYEVNIHKLLKDYGYSDEVVVRNEELTQNDLEQDFVTEIRIRSKR